MKQIFGSMEALYPGQHLRSDSGAMISNPDYSSRTQPIVSTIVERGPIQRRNSGLRN